MSWFSTNGMMIPDVSGVSQHVLRQFSVPTSSASHCDKVARTAKSRDLICWPRGDVNRKVVFFFDQQRLGRISISEMFFSYTAAVFVGWNLTILTAPIMWYSPATRWISVSGWLGWTLTMWVSACLSSGNSLYPPAEIWSATKVGRPSMAIPSGWTISAWPFFDYDVIDILLFKIVYASFQFVIQRSPLDFSSQFQQTKVSKQHFSAQVATAAPQSNSFTPSPAAKTGAASGVPPNL